LRPNYTLREKFPIKATALPISSERLLRYAKLCDRVYPSVFNHGLLGYESQHMIHDRHRRAFARVLPRHDEIVVLFRGTRDHVLDWPVNLRAWRSRAPFPANNPVSVHTGFRRLIMGFDVKKRQPAIEVLVEHLSQLLNGSTPTRPVVLTGHSLGGAAAVLTAAWLHELMPGAVIEVVTFGQPAVGGTAFHDYYPAHQRTHCFFAGADLITFLPGPFYRHVGQNYWLHHNECFAGIPWDVRFRTAWRQPGFFSIRRNHSMKTYIAIAQNLFARETGITSFHGGKTPRTSEQRRE
jgi:triacylglycerol lipase